MVEAQQNADTVRRIGSKHRGRSRSDLTVPESPSSGFGAPSPGGPLSQPLGTQSFRSNISALAPVGGFVSPMRSVGGRLRHGKKVRRGGRDAATIVATPLVHPMRRPIGWVAWSWRRPLPIERRASPSPCVCVVKWLGALGCRRGWAGQGTPTTYLNDLEVGTRCAVAAQFETCQSPHPPPGVGVLLRSQQTSVGTYELDDESGSPVDAARLAAQEMGGRVKDDNNDGVVDHEDDLLGRPPPSPWNPTIHTYNVRAFLTRRRKHAGGKWLLIVVAVLVLALVRCSCWSPRRPPSTPGCCSQRRARRSILSRLRA